MNTGKTLFAQLMDFLPWTTFTRIVDRYPTNSSSITAHPIVRTLSRKHSHGCAGSNILPLERFQ